MSRLDGKVAIVTGGSRGLGGGAVDALCDAGATVIIADIIDDAGREKADRLTAAGHKARYLHLDVRQETQWAGIVADVMREQGRLDCLVNNAGINFPLDIEQSTPEQFQAIFEVNLLGPFLGTKAVIPAMRDSGGGSIINVASNSTAMIVPSTAMYAATKAGIASLAKTTAVHCAVKGYNIRANSIHPGPHETEMMSTPEVKALPMVKKMLDAIPLGRMGTTDDFGRLVVFLASDDSSYMTATEQFIDGGLTAVSFALPRDG